MQGIIRCGDGKYYFAVLRPLFQSTGESCASLFRYFSLTFCGMYFIIHTVKQHSRES